MWYTVGMSSYVIPLFPAAAASPLPTRDAVAAELSRLRDRVDAGLPGKADKVPSAVSGNLASLDASGNLADSGATPESIKAAAVAEVVANAPAALDTLEEIAGILGSTQQTGTVLQRILSLESGKADSSSLAAVATSGSYADLSGKPTIPAAVTVDATLATQGAAADAKAVGDAITPLQMAAWYPDGSVKSPVEWTPKWDGTTGLKYNEAEKDVVNKTVTVCPFCDYSGGTGENNSHLSGRVVIPPYVDIDGERYTVVGIGLEGSFSTVAENYSVESVVAPTTVTGIGLSCLRQCSALTSVVAPGVTKVHNSAFYHCTSLASISLPVATEIGLQVFGNCSSLANASLPSASSAGDSVFSGCSSLVSVSLPAATVNQDAFRRCSSLVSAHLPNATSVGNAAFLDCTSLEYVDFGNAARSAVPTLPATAFSGVPVSCVIIVPDAQYDAWIAANNWSTLYSNGYRFLKHSEWEYARKCDIPYDLVSKTPVSGAVTLSDRAVNLVNPTVTALQEVWEWSDGEDHGQPAYGVVEDYGDYQEYGWGFSGENGTLSHYDSFGNYYDFVWDSSDATELSFYSYDTDATIVASLVTPYETDVSSLTLPPAVTGKVRDFMVRLAVPEHAAMFSWPSGVDFETEDGQMPDVSEPGVYLLAFTETGAGRFALMCRKVQGVE